MSEPIQAAIREVPIQIFDFTTPHEGIAPGFYYNIPFADEADLVNPNEVLLEGPFETRSAALDGARDFIRDCFTNHNEGTVE